MWRSNYVDFDVNRMYFYLLIINQLRHIRKNSFEFVPRIQNTTYVCFIINNEKMNREFQIYKEGKTLSGNVTILSKPGEAFDRAAKMRFYLKLNYRVFLMGGNEIFGVDPKGYYVKTNDGWVPLAK